MPRPKSKEIDEALRNLQEQRKKLQEEKKQQQEERKRLREEKKLQKVNAQLKKMDEAERIDRQKERVIEAVKSRPCIWDKSTLEYRDRYLKTKGWKEISKELDMSEDKVKNMWDNLGDQVREIWRTEKYYSGDGVDDALEERKTWKFYKSLEFLRKVYKFRKTDSNFKSHDSLSESEDEDADVTSDTELNLNDLDMDPITANDANDDSMTIESADNQISQSENVNSEQLSQDTSSHGSKNRTSNTPGPSSQTKRTKSSTLCQSVKNSSESQKSKQHSRKRNSDEIEEKLISHMELTTKLLNEPDGPNEKFLSYLGETLQDVSVEKRRKCEKDLLKVVNAYSENSEIRITIF